jgi:peptidoglycan/LPS O-acetylase OafA/YrhL
LKEYWNFKRISRDLFVRSQRVRHIQSPDVEDEEKALYVLDGLRALAYLWVANVHVEEGLEIYYSSVHVKHAWGQIGATFVVYAANNGVVVFFVLSGFLIPMVFTSIARKNKVKFMILKINLL